MIPETEQPVRPSAAAAIPPKHSGSFLRRNVALFYLYTGTSKAVFDRGIFILFLIDKGFSSATIGLLQASFFWSNFLSEVPTGIFSDRYGRKYSVMLGLAGTALYCVGALLFDGFALFMGIYILLGFAYSFISGSDGALLYDTLKQHRREHDFIRINARIQGIGSFALAVAMVAGGFLQRRSWSAVYGAYLAFTLLALGFWAFIRETDIQVRQRKVQNPSGSCRYSCKSSAIGSGT